MKAYKIIYLTVFMALTLSGCENLVDNLNENPNQFTIGEVEAGNFLNGAELSNSAIQLGPLNRMAGYYSGQLIGYEQVELERYLYNVSNLTFDFDGYQGVVAPARMIRSRVGSNPLYQGITKVLEAQLIGTYASLFGDIPYSEAVSDVKNPKFDDQIEIYNNLQLLLQEAIDNLTAATATDVVLEDYIFSGNRQKWLQSAYTLKARYYMITKQYTEAYAAAQNGISINANSMKFIPKNVVGVNNVKNKYFIALSNYPKSLGTGNCYLIQLLDPASGISRNNAKTNESARLKYYTIQTTATANTGIANELEAEPMISYQENLLILAEAGARVQGITIGLGHLNTLRALLSTGNLFNASVSALPKTYDAYEAADFDAGGIENQDNIDPLRALLREIIEERYISGFTTFMPFDDARRLRKSDSDIAVPFPLNTATATQNVERLLYPQTELLSNQNAPEDPGLFAKTKVNK